MFGGHRTIENGPVEPGEGALPAILAEIERRQAAEQKVVALELAAPEPLLTQLADSPHFARRGILLLRSRIEGGRLLGYEELLPPPPGAPGRGNEG